MVDKRVSKTRDPSGRVGSNPTAGIESGAQEMVTSNYDRLDTFFVYSLALCLTIRHFKCLRIETGGVDISYFEIHNFEPSQLMSTVPPILFCSEAQIAVTSLQKKMIPLSTYSLGGFYCLLECLIGR